MKPSAKEHIMKYVIDEFLSTTDRAVPFVSDELSVYDSWDLLIEAGHYDILNDKLQYEFRCSGEETNMTCEYSRHYESVQVARDLGHAAVSWTYWYGGGKHGEPESIDWLDDAYFVKCEKVVKTVNVFSKVD